VGAEADGFTDPMATLHAGMRRFLEACADPLVERILLLDGLTPPAGQHP
jgi:hypothetical protein